MRSSDKCCYHRRLIPPHSGILSTFSHTPTSVNRFKNSACALDFPLNLYNLVQPFIYLHTEFVPFSQFERNSYAADPGRCTRLSWEAFNRHPLLCSLPLSHPCRPPQIQAAVMPPKTQMSFNTTCLQGGSGNYAPRNVSGVSA